MPNDRLSAGRQEEKYSDEPPGIVVTQFPEAGMEVDPGTQISFEISAGQHEDLRIRVPNLIGLTLKQAAEILRKSELFVGEINEKVSDQKEGVVLSQFPEPGTPVQRGEPVNVSYSVKDDYVPAGKKFPPWIFWGAGVLVAGIVGGIAGRKIGHRNNKKLARKDIKIQLKPICDLGKQTISVNDKGSSYKGVRLKYISDNGTQTLKTD